MLPTSQHRVLSAFAYVLTGFAITDAIDLQEHEPPLTAETRAVMDHYEKINAVRRLFEESNRMCNALLNHGLPNTRSARRRVDKVPVRRSHAGGELEVKQRPFPSTVTCTKRLLWASVT